MRERPLLGHVLDVARKKHSPAAPILARSNRHTTAENLEDHIKSPMNCTILCSNLEKSPPKSPNTSWSHLKSSKFIWNLGKMPEKYQLITIVMKTGWISAWFSLTEPPPQPLPIARASWCQRRLRIPDRCVHRSREIIVGFHQWGYPKLAGWVISWENPYL